MRLRKGKSATIHYIYSLKMGRAKNNYYNTIIVQQNFVYIESILKSIKYKIIRNVIPKSPSIIQDNRPNTIHTMDSR